jgi:membrane protease YdiL (CAAX protease family)
MSTGRSIASSTPGSDARTAGLILVATLALTFFSYWTRADILGVTNSGGDWQAMTGRPLSVLKHNLAGGLILGLVPLVLGRYLCRMRYLEFGLGLGNIRRGLVWLAIGIPVAVLAGKLSSGQIEMRAVYPLDPQLTSSASDFARHAGLQLLYYCGWEVLFRGVLLSGLTRRFGFATANIIQTALSVIAHFGRPFTETAASIPAGLAFGGVARHSGSVWYVIIIHWVVGMALDWFIITGQPY